VTCQHAKVRNSLRFSHLRAGAEKQDADVRGREQGEMLSGMRQQRLG